MFLPFPVLVLCAELTEILLVPAVIVLAHGRPNTVLVMEYHLAYRTLPADFITDNGSMHYYRDIELQPVDSVREVV